ncbi:GIY-YIG nuclease family protein [Microbacterium sp. SS28]|uniref:GIY-YIG nuclease family protein n=1 Tax=Microbacterium sp. SS28 TaxID=2919948 RepID=UPI001FAA9AEE|nr:GIY-YIG nuclease family protein [Microbacterium sp. SS28]
MSSRCLVNDGCRGDVPADAPLALCELHLAVAADWAASAYGVTDALPAPCRLCGSRLGIRHPSGWLCATCEFRHGDIVDDELPPPRVDVVYYLGYADRVKIGTTSNPRQRFAAIWHDDLLALERGDRHLERRRHAEFAADRFDSTEWFAHSDALSAHVEALRAGRDPWEDYLRWVSEAVALRG